MKKIFIVFMLIIISLSFIACNGKRDINASFSEITYVYFQASAEGVNSSISVGQREEPYVIDGKHGKNCGFSLINLKFEEQVKENKIVVDLNVNNQITQLTLELNPANHFYMADLGYELNKEDIINLSYENYNLCYENISKDFAITYEKAILIAEDNYKEYINTLYKGKTFNGECYLKILTLNNNGKDELFWIYTIVNNHSQHKNIIINTETGKVLIKD